MVKTTAPKLINQRLMSSFERSYFIELSKQAQLNHEAKSTDLVIEIEDKDREMIPMVAEFEYADLVKNKLYRAEF